MSRWKATSRKKLRQGHKRLAGVLRQLGCSGVKPSTWVKTPEYTASLARYSVSSLWFDQRDKLWSHTFKDFQLHEKKAVKVWIKTFVHRGLCHAVRVTVTREGDCKVNMMIGAEQAPF